MRMISYLFSESTSPEEIVSNDLENLNPSIGSEYVDQAGMSQITSLQNEVADLRKQQMQHTVEVLKFEEKIRSLEQRLDESSKKKHQLRDQLDYYKEKLQSLRKCEAAENMDINVYTNFLFLICSFSMGLL